MLSPGSRAYFPWSITKPSMIDTIWISIGVQWAASATISTLATLLVFTCRECAGLRHPSLVIPKHSTRASDRFVVYRVRAAGSGPSSVAGNPSVRTTATASIASCFVTSPPPNDLTPRRSSH